MTQAEIIVGKEYFAKVSGQIVPLRVLRRFEHFSGNRSTCRWECLNTRTGKTIVVKSCRRFRSACPES